MDRRNRLFEDMRFHLEAVGDLESQRTMLERFKSMVEMKVTTSRGLIQQQFVHEFFKYKQSVELELEYTISVINSRTLVSTFVEKVRYKSLLRKLQRTHQYLGSFHGMFYGVYGWSLSEAKQQIEREVSLKKI